MKKTLLIALFILIFAASTFAGVEWRARTVTAAQAKGQSNTIEMQIFAQGGNVKQVFEIVKDENEMFQKGSYWLFKAADSSFYLVNPTEKTYSRLPMNAMMQMAGVVGKLVKIKIKNPVVNNEKLGTEVVLGYPCQHSKLLMEYDMEVKIAIIKSKSHVKVEKEVWATPKVKAMSEMAEAFRFRDFKTGMEDLDDLIEQQMKAEAEQGFPLKMITVNTTVDKKGNVKETSRTTMEVLSLGNKNLPASFFEVPAGYEEKSMGFNKEEE
jgi:acetyltransferase-like isoleucine patch superfamily enzyme